MQHLIVAPAQRQKWREHEEWGNCTGCPLHKFRHKIVLARGHIPADVLFIGEAPGPSENTLGIPFAPNAPAGGLLDDLIERAYFGAQLPATPLGYYHPEREEAQRSCDAARPRYCITNIVACFPQKNPQGDFREPNKEEALACRQRLLEFMGICQPRLIVTLGVVAQRYLPDLPRTVVVQTRKLPGSTIRLAEVGAKAKVLPLLHPSAINRLERDQPTKAELAKKRFVLALSAALKELSS